MPEVTTAAAATTLTRKSSIQHKDGGDAVPGANLGQRDSRGSALDATAKREDEERLQQDVDHIADQGRLVLACGVSAWEGRSRTQT